MASQYSLVYKIGELEGKLSGKSKDPLVKTQTNCIDSYKLKLLEVNPANMVGMTYLRALEVDVSIYRAVIIERLEKDDAEGE